jgi:hypothetical protein
MLHAQALQSPATRLHPPPVTAILKPLSRPEPAPSRLSPADYDNGLIATAGPIMAGAYAAALAIAAFTFMSRPEAMFAVVISFVFGTVYFAVAAVLFYVRQHRDHRWRTDGREKHAHQVAIYTGTIHRTEALLQMTIVPLAVVCAFSAFAFIWLTTRPFP